MCQFWIDVDICGCDHPDCKQTNPEIGDKSYAVLRDVGHVLKIRAYSIEGRICYYCFENDDPHRLVIRLGLDPNDPNSKLDCRYKTWIIGEHDKTTDLCERCKETCNDPPELFMFED